MPDEPSGAGSPSAGRREQTVFGLDGNRRGVAVTPGKSQINGSSDVPEHLKNKVSQMVKTDAAYRDTPQFDKTHYCDIYDTAPPTPQ